ncbi:hypothetical protein [Demequina sp. NBRC 110053]|nr:hypothetical protein [Demequina sp. NBRC 110053]
MYELLDPEAWLAASALEPAARAALISWRGALSRPVREGGIGTE